MPKASVNENYSLESGQDNVRLSGKRFLMQPKTEPQPV
jgi:hypothetical protein